MTTFQNFLIKKLNEEAPPAAGGIGAPASLPPAGPTGAGMPPPPMGGGMPPMGGGMPPMGGGMPPMGGGMPPMGGDMSGSPTAAPNKLKAYNVWDVLEKVLNSSN